MAIDSEFKIQALGVTKKELNNLRIKSQSPDLRLEAIIEGAKTYQKLDHNFTFDELSYLLFPTDNLSKGRSKIRNQLKKKYSKEKAKLESEFGFKLAYLNVLKKDLGIYEGNLFESRQCWDKFIPSRNDFLNNIKIPLVMDDDSFRILGYLWNGGTIRLSKEYNKITFYPSPKNQSFIKYFLAPKIKEIFNYTILDDYNQIKVVGNQGDSMNWFYVDIFSKAISTWLLYDLKFSKDKKKRTRPEIINSEHEKKCFLEGILAIGNYDFCNNYPRIRINSHGGNNTKPIRGFFGDLGIRTAYSKKDKNRITICRKKDVRMVLSEFELFNNDLKLIRKYA